MKFISDEELDKRANEKVKIFVNNELFAIHEAINKTIDRNCSIDKAKKIIYSKFAYQNVITPSTSDNILKLTELKHNIYLLEQCIKHNITKTLLDFYKANPCALLTKEEFKEIEAQNEKK